MHIICRVRKMTGQDRLTVQGRYKKEKTMLYLGPLFDRANEKELLSLVTTGVPNAANRFQYNLISGLLANDVSPLRIVNVLPVGYFPRFCRKLFLKSRRWSLSGIPCHELGSINVPVLKQMQREAAARKILRRLTEEDKEILIYSTYLPFLRAVQGLDDSVKVTLIVADLPEYYDLGKTSGLRKTLRRINNNLIHKSLRRVDRFVLLTEQMKEPLQVGDRTYTIVEGICDSAELPGDDGNSAPDAVKGILYTGGLHYRFGIKTLLDAFQMLEDNDAELWLCGVGDAVPEIRERAQKDSRIKYFGYLTVREVDERRKKAAVMINPRTNSGEYTKYSFPSKTMEYMLSGKPVIMYALDGMPAAYRDYLFVVPEDGAQALHDTIKKVLAMDEKERRAFGLRAAQFVAREKNPQVQAKRVIDLIKGTAPMDGQMS